MTCLFDRLISDVMSKQTYRSAARVFWIMDNSLGHRGFQSGDSRPSSGPSCQCTHALTHTWLNQVETHFSIIRRKVLRPNTSPHWQNCRTAYSRSSSTINMLHLPFVGPSPTRIWLLWYYGN